METKSMARALSMFSLGGVFLLISPKLRLDVFTALGYCVTTMEFYAPYSYVAGVILVFVSMVVAFNRGSRVR